MPRIDFVCPECGGETLAAIQHSLVCEEILGMEDPEEYGMLIDYGDLLDRRDLDMPEAYECAMCSHQIAVNIHDLYDWLKEHKMLSEEEVPE